MRLKFDIRHPHQHNPEWVWRGLHMRCMQNSASLLTADRFRKACRVRRRIAVARLIPDRALTCLLHPFGREDALGLAASGEADFETAEIVAVESRAELSI